MKRFLWITRQDPRPADSGEFIYSLGLMRALAATEKVHLTVIGHEAQSVGGELTGIDWILPLRIPGKSVTSLISALPSDAHRLGSGPMRQALRRALAARSFDGVVIDQAANGWALADLPPDLPLLYLSHNHEAVVRKEVASAQEGSLPMRMALRLDASKYAALERRICARAKAISAITPRDEKHYRAEFPDKDYVQLTPGFEGTIPDSPPAAITGETPRRVVLAGTFEWIAKRRNLEAFLRDAEKPFQAKNIGFHVVGKAKPAYFNELSQRFPWATFTPNVPSMEPHLREARMGLIPEALGGGFKLKALDYIFHGLPLASIRSALSGLPLTPGEDVIAAETTRELAQRVADAIDLTDQLNHFAGRALDQCRGAFDWTDRGQTLASALLRL